MDEENRELLENAVADDTDTGAAIEAETVVTGTDGDDVLIGDGGTADNTDGSDAEVDTDADAITDTTDTADTTDTETEAETTDTEAETDIESDTETETETTDTESSTETDTEADTETDTETTDTESSTETDTEADTETEAETDTESDTETETETTDTESSTETDTDTEAETTESSTEAEVETEADAEIESVAENTGDSDADTSEDASDDSLLETIDLTDLGDQSVRFTVDRDAGFENTVGFYEVTEDGSVVDPVSGESIAIGETGYTDAAIANALDFSLSNPTGQTTEFVEDLAGGTQYASFIIADGTIEQLQDSDTSNDPVLYFGAASLNSDNVDHINRLGENTLGYEDLAAGGDADYNDLTVEYEFI